MRRLGLLVLVVLVGGLAAGCTGGVDEPSSSAAGPFPTPAPPETLLPVVVEETDPLDPRDSLPPDAMFGGEVCTALDGADFAGLGTSGAPQQLSADACGYPLGNGTVVVQLASPDQFARPGAEGEEIAPIDGVGLDAIGVDLTTEYRVFVKVENGYFSVTAADRRIAERLAKAAAARTLP